uniref:Uncharacterized protein n=1 Tax=Rhizophora mucronata TaxID=61149 RepID=A0A2P2Q9N7_RHIMU
MKQLQRGINYEKSYY